MKLLVVNDSLVLQFVVIVPEDQTHEHVKERVTHHVWQAIENNPDDWTYSGIRLALCEEGYTIIGGLELDEVTLES